MTHAHHHDHDHDDHPHNSMHAHSHSHTPHINSHNEKKVLLSFSLIFAFMIIEAVGGVLSGSLALLADAGHMVTDAAALALAYVAFRLGRREPDDRRTFGYLRLEVVAGFINAVTLLLIVVWIIYEAWQRLQSPHDILAPSMFFVALTGMIVNVLVFWILTQGDNSHVNIKAAILHVVGDLLGSIGTMLAAAVIYFTGWTLVDPILSVIVSLLIVNSAWRLLRKSMNILLEGAPDNITPELIKQYIEAEIAGVTQVNHVHVWQITSGRTLATLHVRPKTDKEARNVSSAVENILRIHFKIEHATVAVDWNDEALDACSLTQPVSQEVHSH